MSSTTDYHIELKVTHATQAGAAVEHLTFLDDIGPVKDPDRNPHGDLIAYTYRGISRSDAKRHADQVVGRLRHAGIGSDISDVCRHDGAPPA